MQKNKETLINQVQYVKQLELYVLSEEVDKLGLIVKESIIREINIVRSNCLRLFCDYKRALKMYNNESISHVVYYKAESLNTKLSHYHETIKDLTTSINGEVTKVSSAWILKVPTKSHLISKIFIDESIGNKFVL